jgi:TolB-like protein/tetratricopeptide (TPR) repeat protein
MDDANRRLAGILAADVVGYSAMVGTDEPATLARVRTLRTDVIEPVAASYGGRLFKTTGDGVLIAFASAVQALRCAIAIQERLRSEPDGLRLRIGVHQGEVVAEGDDLLGDGVIIAARLEPLAEPGGICISARVREDAAGKMALEVVDLGTQALKNIATRIQVFRVRLGMSERPVLPLPHKPSIAVLAFTNMSGDPEQEYFADGIVEEITTALSRIPSFFVIARNSSFAYKGKSPDVRQVGQELGARYVLEGSVRKAASQVRITGQLIDTTTGAHLWADRFEGNLTDIFQLQDHVTVSVVGAIEPRIRQAEIDRALHKPTENMEAYDLVLRGRWNYEAVKMERYEEAARLYRRAIELDPNYALPHALLARTLWMVAAQQLTQPSGQDLAEYVSLARSAVQLGQADPETLGIAAHIIALPGGDMAEGIAIVDRALELNPNSADQLAISGMLRAYSGDTLTAVRHLQDANRLSPLGVRINFLNWGLMVAAFVDADYAGVADRTAEGLRQDPNNVALLRYRTAALALLGRLDETRQAVNRLLALNPELTVTRCRRHVEFEMKNPFKRPGVVEAYYQGLRLAGLPE